MEAPAELLELQENEDAIVCCCDPGTEQPQKYGLRLPGQHMNTPKAGTGG